MTGFAVSNEELAALGKDGSRKYGECMQAYNFMMDGIKADPRFVAERPLAVGENREVKLKYWTVTLPGKMLVQESGKAGNYEAVFFAEVTGEMVLLYRITIADEPVGSLLGYFEIDGVMKPISIESYELAERDSWNDEDYAAANRMMDTINDVIRQVTSSEKYSEFSE